MSIKDFTERRQFRGRFTPDELRRDERALEKYRRETISTCVCGRPLSDGHQHSGDGYVYVGHHRVYVGNQPITDELLDRAKSMVDYDRHTVDIAHPAPQHVEDEALAFERGYRKAKVAWCVLLVLVAGYVAWRLVK